DVRLLFRPPPPPRPPLFPYTTLFRSGTVTLDGVEAALGTGAARVAGRLDTKERSIEIGFAATDWPLGFTQRFDAALGDFVGGLVDRKSTRLNSSHVKISYAVFCLKKK